MLKNQIIAKFTDAISFIKLSANTKLAVAVSGGADSLFLTLMLDYYARSNNLKLIAITIDHRLRPEALLEAKQVAHLLKEKNIEHHILTIKTPYNDKNIQQQARNRRYELLIKFCHQHNINYLFIGHNKNDVAETFFLNLLRGSGLDGLCAIRSKNNIAKINIIRPLLNFTRDEIEAYLKNENIIWINDPSNQNIKYDRVKIRHLINKLDINIDRIALAANNLRSAKKCLDNYFISNLKKYIKIYDFGVAEIDSDFFLLDEYEIKTIFSYLLQIIGGKYYKARLKSLNSSLNEIAKKGFKSLSLQNCIIHKYRNNFYIYRENKNIETIPVNNDNDILWDNRFEFRIPKKLLALNCKITALSEKNWQNLDKEKILISNILNKMPRAVIYSMPTFKVDDKIIFIPFINYALKTDYYNISYKFRPIKVIDNFDEKCIIKS